MSGCDGAGWDILGARGVSLALGWVTGSRCPGSSRSGVPGRVPAWVRAQRAGALAGGAEEFASHTSWQGMKGAGIHFLVSCSERGGRGCKG